MPVSTIKDKMALPTIKDDFKNFFNDVNTMAKERPLVTIIYALALTIIAGTIASHSLILGLCVFSISLPFHISVIKNFKTVCLNFEEKMKDIVKGDPREKGKILGARLRGAINQVYGRSVGFLEGFFLKKNRDKII